MIVYGDQARTDDPSRMLGSIRQAEAAARALSGLPRHDCLVGALIEAGELSQGIADAEMQAAGRDRASPAQSAAQALVLSLAHRVAASWTGRRNAPDDGSFRSAFDALAALVLPAGIIVKQPEGYAHYALYPEAYHAAGCSLPPTARVIGLRSIGTSLAAMVAAGAGAKAPLTLRPVGHPFRRAFNIDPALLADLMAATSALYAIVDEGPGLSGSSFCALADLLEEAGARPEQIIFCPGHAGSPGREASVRHKARWAGSRRIAVPFDELIAPRLAAAVEDLTGPALAPPEDLSGGAWRSRLYPSEREWPPVHAMQERRKFLLQASTGEWLLKFVGLGRPGPIAFEAAQRLHAAGFGPRPLGVRLGFLVTSWHGKAVPLPLARLDRSAVMDTLGRYLGHRSTLLAPLQSGADLASLGEMSAINIREALGEAAETRWRQDYRLPSPLPDLVRVETDNRLHQWEWLIDQDGRMIKTDGIDHHRAHDLVGCQDISWDIAGAAIEFDCSDDEISGLIAAVAGVSRRSIDPGLVRWMTAAYLAFQLGLWTMAAEGASANERPRIDAKLEHYRSALRLRP